MIVSETVIAGGNAVAGITTTKTSLTATVVGNLKAKRFRAAGS